MGDLRCDSLVNLPNHYNDNLRVTVGRDVEIDQLAAKAARLPGAEGDAGDHPRDADELRRRAEVDPQEQANRETGQRRQRIAERTLPLADEVVDEGGQVHSHEGDEG